MLASRRPKQRTDRTGLAGSAALRLSLLALIPLAAACSAERAAPAPATPSASAEAPLRVLVLHGGGYHAFAENLALLFVGLDLPEGSWVSDLAVGPDDPRSATREERLAQLAAMDLPAEVDVVLVYTQGDLGFPPEVRAALLAFVQGGGGLVGLHSASDSHPDWPEWGALIGARFENHPPFGPVTVRVDPPPHPVTAGLPAEFQLQDEFYHLKELQLDDATILMTGVSPAGGERRPVTWVRSPGKGRLVYTILGHGPEAHADPNVRRLVGQALLWAAAAP